MTEKLRWGLLSTAHINEALFEPLRASKRNRLVAVASRTSAKAQAYSRQHKIGRAHGSYEALLRDPEVDVIYIPLPNSEHASWSVRALEAGKHVLCEKPLALSVEEVDAMARAAALHGRVVVEALMYRSHAQTLRVREIVQSGQLGQVRLVRGTFNFPGTKPDDYRMKPEMGGGCLWDVGVYPLSFTRFVLGSEPLEVFGWQTLGETGVDLSFVSQIRFPDEVTLQLDCSMASPYHVFMEIVGSEGSLVVPQPYGPGLKNSLYLTRKGKTETLAVKGAKLYVDQVERMADAILGLTPPAVALSDSRQTTATLVALFESARSGRPVLLPPAPAELG